MQRLTQLQRLHWVFLRLKPVAAIVWLPTAQHGCLLFTYRGCKTPHQATNPTCTSSRANLSTATPRSAPPPTQALHAVDDPARCCNPTNLHWVSQLVSFRDDLVTKVVGVRDVLLQKLL